MSKTNATQVPFDPNTLQQKHYKANFIQKMWRKNAGFFIIILWLVGFVIFKLYPFASSLYYSFTDFHLFKGITKTGFMNYEKVFSDKEIIKALGITFQYAFLTVPIKLVAALFIAYILNFKIKGVNIFRTGYYIPSILGGSVAIAVLWKAIFQNNGLLNSFLAFLNSLLPFLNISQPDWLGDPAYALTVIILLRVWQFGSAMVIFLAALKAVPEDLYEAATIDGAGKARQFFAVTVPMITPVIFYNLVTQLVQAFQEFNGPFIITQGKPRGATTLISMLIYNRAFKRHEMGIASAMAWVLFLIVMILTLLAFISQKYWVYYSDEGK